MSGNRSSLRQFDISDRTSNRFLAILMYIPISSLSLNGSVSAGNEDRPDGVFGLRSNDNHAYSFGMDYVPKQSMSMGFSFEHENFTSLQRSRQATPDQFNDPTRDWTISGDDTADTFTASVDLLKLVLNTDIRVGYNLSRADSTYTVRTVSQHESGADRSGAFRQERTSAWNGRRPALSDAACRGGFRLLVTDTESTISHSARRR